ncbi:double-strand break repair protein AddB [Cognatishimia activa]|uniref:Double-strand break repair protein AddB n=1 Tax=Cognatishimia activa TaxID=1715691 RepID=A0A0P1IM06_9RHOB|nr:double-strand break repair protein AddB [Cognatishimia activa]CUI40699.1 double-strand break repair protein AddB [Cognatishimia activa]CUK24556.1 double-strand break repair protein AddB [Cognatishimia activa]
MFSPKQNPRVYGVAPGIDFPQALWHGVLSRMQGQPPEAMARVQIIVNTQRMARRLRSIADRGPATLMPRIDLLTHVGKDLAHKEIPAAVNPLRRRFELIQLIARLLEQQPDLAPRASLYDLADSLAGLMDEMSGEGVSADTIEKLDVTDQSGHWERAQAFFGIARQFLSTVDDAPDSETRQRMIIQRLADHWADNPPEHPVILAGSTGSRGTTMLLMQAVAKLPQGALVLPGFDFDTPPSVWSALSDALTAEDHPQYRFAKVLSELGLTADEVQDWSPEAIAPCPERNKLISLALRPAPVTDQWRREGPDLTGLDLATQNVTLLEAPSMREEALAIAMRLRQAAEDGQTAALITPDRMLTRQVTAALDRWDILPDDSAGTPLQLSPPGRFLRHVGALMFRPLTSESLLTLLKHPLTHSGEERNNHLRFTRELELYIRRKGITFPDPEVLAAWSKTIDGAESWGDWVVRCFCNQETPGSLDFEDHLSTHLARAELIARGSVSDAGTGGLWDEKAGRDAVKTVSNLQENAQYAGELTAAAYMDLFGAVLSQGEVRDRDAPHPNILIWGTLEARVQGADLTILGGLNEGSWPENAKPDPWLNRKMRHDAGLLLPERRIGLSAHDFQQAVGAKEVWLTRSIRSDDAETVPSRWINRLVNLLEGLPQQNGPEVLDDMRERGGHWLGMVQVLEEVAPVPAAKRPSPKPPVASRPTRLSVTEIKKLIRDPYAIYARHTLRLRPMDPLMRTPDALLRGIVIHEVLEQFIKDVSKDRTRLTPEHLLELAETVLAKNVPWPTARNLWKARIERIANQFIADEGARQNRGKPVGFETKAKTDIANLGFTLTGTADRIDRTSTGDLVIYDYKTGAPPTQAEQRYFDKQLLLEAAMAEKGGFMDIEPAEVLEAIYIGLSNSPKTVAAPLIEMPTAQVWAEFEQLIARYLDADQGFTSRRALRKDTDYSDYDQLARFGEWDVTDEPTSETLS